MNQVRKVKYGRYSRLLNEYKRCGIVQYILHILNISKFDWKVSFSMERGALFVLKSET